MRKFSLFIIIMPFLMAGCSTNNPPGWGDESTHTYYVDLSSDKIYDYFYYNCYSESIDLFPGFSCIDNAYHFQGTIDTKYKDEDLNIVFDKNLNSNEIFGSSDYLGKYTVFNYTISRNDFAMEIDEIYHEPVGYNVRSHGKNIEELWGQYKHNERDLAKYVAELIDKEEFLLMNKIIKLLPKEKWKDFMNESENQ